jgi:thiamine-phosphate pyrophosphorylase
MNKPILPAGIYGITALEYSRGRNNIEVVKEMVRGGVSVVQYREKSEKTAREKYEECREIRKITGDSGVLFLVNDFIDIAMLADADGVHIGQDDLPLPGVRKLVGDKIIGISTHSPEQAEKALAEGADYIGVGPIFMTRTKKNVCAPVGLEYLDFVVKNINLPFVAIGGIKENCIEEVASHGAKTIALVTEIVGAPDIAGMVKRLSAKMHQK